LADKGKDALDDTKSRIKKAIDAGVEAYKEEKEKAERGGKDSKISRGLRPCFLN